MAVVGAVVVGRIDISKHSADAGAVGRTDRSRIWNLSGRRRVDGLATCGVSRDEIQTTWSQGAERSLVVAVAHREVLRVVPQRGDGVAVVVVNVEPGSPEEDRLADAGVRLGVLDEIVHLAAVECALFGGVAVVLVAGESFRGG